MLVSGFRNCIEYNSTILVTNEYFITLLFVNINDNMLIYNVYSLPSTNCLSTIALASNITAPFL